MIAMFIRAYLTSGCLSSVQVGGGMHRSLKSTGAAITTSVGTPLQKDGVRSLRSTKTSLRLITKPVVQPRSTHIICTMGPQCWSEEGMTKLLDAGLDIIRLNFSHGDHKGHLEVCFTLGPFMQSHM